MTLMRPHVSQKGLRFLAFLALIATSQSGVILSMPDNQSYEDSGDSGSESVEIRDSTLILPFVHGVKHVSYGAAVKGGRPSEPATDAPQLLPRFGGGDLASGNTAPTTELPSNTSEPSRAAEQDRSKSPIFNIWEYAKIAGPFHVRTGDHGNDTQQTTTSGLNRCEWAIISCCQNQERNRRNTCFNALHCGGAWFGNPCSERLQRAVYGRLLEVGPF